MRIKQFAVAAGLLVFTAQAQAGYICISPNGDEKLTVSKVITRVGDTQVKIENEAGVQKCWGQMTSSGSLFIEKTVKCYWSDVVLKIVHLPQQCGRGYCPPGQNGHITASLKTEDHTSNYSCELTND